MLIAALLIFVDSVKELPATLLLRPFGFNTLATHVYDFASRTVKSAPGCPLVPGYSLLVVLLDALALGIHVTQVVLCQDT